VSSDGPHILGRMRTSTKLFAFGVPIFLTLSLLTAIRLQVGATEKSKALSLGGSKIAALTEVSDAVASSDNSTKSLDRSQAIEIAAGQLGLIHYDELKVGAFEVSLKSESLPFLAPSLGGKNTWRIEFSDLDLARASGNPVMRNQAISKLIVILAPGTGNIMKVTSVWPSELKRMAEYPPCAEEARQLSQCGIRYTSLPARSPNLTFFDALAASIGWSKNVKQVCASYVNESTADYENRAVWVIQLRGSSGLPISPGTRNDVQLSKDATDHSRDVIDAESGDWLYASTIPQPCLPLEYRY
jgi:hypothetical protein